MQKLWRRAYQRILRWLWTAGRREDLRISQALGEIFGDILTWDSRLWRTAIALIFRPGFLTAEFIAGRRARYVPPFRLYLIISFLIFLFLSVGSRIDALGLSGDQSDPRQVQGPWRHT